MTFPKFAILMDGGFVTKKLQPRLGQFPAARDIQAEVDRISGDPWLKGHALLRVYFYDAAPATGRLINPIDGSPVDLGATPSTEPRPACTRAWNCCQTLPCGWEKPQSTGGRSEHRRFAT
jgi:hypothetical protein